MTERDFVSNFGDELGTMMKDDVLTVKRNLQGLLATQVNVKEHIQLLEIDISALSVQMDMMKKIGGRSKRNANLPCVFSIDHGLAM